MNIALLSEKYPPAVGGLAVSVERIARLLLEAGHTVHSFTLDSNLPAGELVLDCPSGIHVHRLGPQPRLSDTLILWSDTIIRHSAELARVGQHFDLLHGYFLPQAGFTAVYTARMLGVPAVVSARGNDLDRAVFEPGKAAHIFYALQHASAVTANTQELAQKVNAFCARQAVLIPNGVDGQHFQPLPPNPELANRLGLQGKVLGFAGEGRAKKGLAVLLLAMQEIDARLRVLGEQASLLLVGGVRSGEDRDLYKVFRKQHPALNIVLTGFVPLGEMPGYYNLMDVLLMPSLHDGLPNALLEAMACGLPVAAARAGGIPDALTDGLNGRLVEPGEVSGLVEIVSDLLENPEVCRQLGQAARQTVLSQFSLEQELEKTLHLYRTLCSQPAAS